MGFLPCRLNGVLFREDEFVNFIKSLSLGLDHLVRLLLKDRAVYEIKGEPHVEVFEKLRFLHDLNCREAVVLRG